MTIALDVTLSAQASLLNRIDTIAHNVANVSTAGFRASNISFEEVVSRQTDEPTAFVRSGETHFSHQTGELVPTGSKFDIAVKGDAWFGIETPDGPAYTRDGRMQMDANGELRSVEGYRYLDAGGSPLVLDPNAGPPDIARDGMILQNNRQLGAVGLFRIDPTIPAERLGNSALKISGQAEPILDFTEAGVVQGFVENSNVNPVLEITHLITAHRGFDQLGQSIRSIEDSMRNAIRTLGDVS